MRDLTESYPELRDALSAHLSEHFVEPLDQYGYQDNAVHTVSAASYDGFIAFTNGGFRVLVHCDLSTLECEGGMSEFESAQLQQYIDSSHDDAAQEFVTQRDYLNEAYETSGNDSVSDWLYNRWSDAEDMHERQPQLFDNVQFWNTPLGHEREEFYDFDTEWMREGGTFFYECTVLFYERGHRRNITGSDELFIFSGINTDFEYGRERGLAICFEKTYKLSRLTPERLRVIVEACADRITH